MSIRDGAPVSAWRPSLGSGPGYGAARWLAAFFVLAASTALTPVIALGLRVALAWPSLPAILFVVAAIALQLGPAAAAYALVDSAPPDPRVGALRTRMRQLERALARALSLYGALGGGLAVAALAVGASGAAEIPLARHPLAIDATVLAVFPFGAWLGARASAPVPAAALLRLAQLRAAAWVSLAFGPVTASLFGGHAFLLAALGLAPLAISRASRSQIPGAGARVPFRLRALGAASVLYALGVGVFVVLLGPSDLARVDALPEAVPAPSAQVWLRGVSLRVTGGDGVITVEGPAGAGGGTYDLSPADSEFEVTAAPSATDAPGPFRVYATDGTTHYVLRLDARGVRLDDEPIDRLASVLETSP